LNSCQLISASLEQNKIFEIIQSYFRRELNAGYSAIYAKHDERLVRIKGVDPQETQDRTLEEILSIAIHAANPIHGMAENSELYRFIDRNQLVPSIFTFRFHCAGESDYYCICLNPEKPNPVDVFESQLRMLRAQIEVTGKNIEHYKGVQQLVYVDDVTGLYNTRYLNQTLEREIVQAQSNEKSFAVLFIDADRFKGVNDLYGHINGSKLLNELGNQLKRYVRDKDAVFRYGGDEFLAVLSPCDLNTAKTVAERIRESVEKTDFLKNDNLNIKITVSIGIALFPDHASTKKEIVEAADHAMYDAKKKSRNCVFVTKINKETGKKKKNYGR
jgi:diguanylate cyclase (GGDEF)-like protein